MRTPERAAAADLPLRLVAAALLAAALLLGFAQLAGLPPWEGFDETEHYSYIQQLAETGTWPRFGDPGSAEIDDYARIAPGPAAYFKRWSYAGVFSAPPATVAAVAAAVHGARDPQRPWRPGQVVNWEAQHPPLYYLLMVPVYLVSKGWSLAAQLLLMRGLTYLIAWLGLCAATLAAFATASTNPLLRCTLVLAPALWPHVFPGWFPEMARIGNDGLVVLLAACAWISLMRFADSKTGLLQHAILGLICGIGLLTKATFLPFAALAAGFLALRVWQQRGSPSRMGAELLGLAIFVAVTVMISGWWYVGKYIETGDWLGSNDLVHLEQAGGLLRGLREHDSVYQFLRILPSPFTAFLWPGTWSFATPLFISYLPLVLLTVLMSWGWWRLRYAKPGPSYYLPIVLLLIFLAALTRQTLVLRALGLPAGIADWYLHSFAPVLAPLVGFGLAGVAHPRGLRAGVFALMFYPCAFLVVATAQQWLFFSGCEIRPASLWRYDVSSFACAADPSTVMEHLAVLAFPQLAIILFAAGWLVMLLAIAAAVRLIGRSARGV